MFETINEVDEKTSLLPISKLSKEDIPSKPFAKNAVIMAVACLSSLSLLAFAAYTSGSAHIISTSLSVGDNNPKDGIVTSYDNKVGPGGVVYCNEEGKGVCLDRTLGYCWKHGPCENMPSSMPTFVPTSKPTSADGCDPLDPPCAKWMMGLCVSHHKCLTNPTSVPTKAPSSSMPTTTLDCNPKDPPCKKKGLFGICYEYYSCHSEPPTSLPTSVPTPKPSSTSDCDPLKPPCKHDFLSVCYEYWPCGNEGNHDSYPEKGIVFPSITASPTLAPTEAGPCDPHKCVPGERFLGVCWKFEECHGNSTFTEGEKSDEPAEGEKSDEPAEGEKSDEPAEGEKSDEPAEGEKSDEPAEGEKSDEPAEGEKSDEPAEGEKSDEPAEGEKSDEPAEGEKSDEPTEGEKSDEPTEGEKSDEPAEGEKSDEPTEGEKSDEPTEGEKSDEPTEGEKSDEPTEGEKSDEPAEGEKSDEPTEPVTEPTFAPFGLDISLTAVPTFEPTSKHNCDPEKPPCKTWTLGICTKYEKCYGVHTTPNNQTFDDDEGFTFGPTPMPVPLPTAKPTQPPTSMPSTSAPTVVGYTPSPTISMKPTAAETHGPTQAMLCDPQLPPCDNYFFGVCLGKRHCLGSHEPTPSPTRVPTFATDSPTSEPEESSPAAAEPEKSVDKKVEDKRAWKVDLEKKNAERAAAKAARADSDSDSSSRRKFK